MDQVIDDLKNHQIISPGHVAMAFRAFLVSKQDGAARIIIEWLLTLHRVQLNFSLMDKRLKTGNIQKSSENEVSVSVCTAPYVA
jgi:hypothetical protein